MHRWFFPALAAVVVAAPVQSGARQSEDIMAVRTVRFYRAESRQTLVRAFIQIPYVIFQGGAGAGGTDQITYFVTVRVSDSTGLGLLQETWTNYAPRNFAVAGVTTLEMLEFAVLPGSYVLEVSVEDSVTGRKASTSAVTEGFRTPPALSDLLLSPEIRLATPGDTIPRAGELRIGNTLVTGAIELRLTPLKSQAFYLIEAYSEAEASGTLTASIRDSQGNTILQTPAAAVTVPRDRKSVV